VVKTQGRRGEVTSEILSDVPDRFAIGMRLLALPRDSNQNRRELEVEELWPHKGLLVLKFAGVDSISDAEALVGSELQVPRTQRAALEEGWKFVSDLVGCAVLDQGCTVRSGGSSSFNCERRQRAIGGNSVCSGVSRQCGCGAEADPDEIAGRIVGSKCAADR
jgi:hypothetical protein